MLAANHFTSTAAGESDGLISGCMPVGAAMALSSIERDVLGLLLTGLTNKAVAARLEVGERTVERHRAGALRRLGVRTLIEVARLYEPSVPDRDSANPRIPWTEAEVPSSDRFASSAEISPERFASAFRDAASGFLMLDLAGRFLAANRTFCRLLGRSESELLATDVGAVTYPDDRGRDTARNRAFFAGAFETFRSEKRYVRPDGAVVPVYLMGSLVRTSGGRPHFAVGTVLPD